MKLITDLFRRKSDIERQIAVRKSRALEAERALALCEELQATLPMRIAELRAQPVELVLSSLRAAEDFQARFDLSAQMEQLAAAEAVLRDLAKIKQHWTKVGEALSAR